MGLNEDGSMNPISKYVEGDDGYHVKGALVVAPDRSFRQALEQEKRIIAVCGNHPVFVISPWPDVRAVASSLTSPTSVMRISSPLCWLILPS